LAKEVRAAPREPLDRLAQRAASRFETRPAGDARLAFVAGSPEELLEMLREAGAGDETDPAIHVGTGPAGRVAFLYPGQGVQQVGMLREATTWLPEVRASLAEASALAEGVLPRPVHEILYPSSSDGVELRRTDACQLILAALAAGFTDWLQRLGVVPDLATGHSLGELCALYAGGAFWREGLLRFCLERGRLVRQAETQTPGGGGMAAVFLDREELGAFLPVGGPVTLANHNSPSQCVITGPRPALYEVLSDLQAAGVRAVPLYVDGAYHSRFMAPCTPGEADLYQEHLLRPPGIQVISCLDGAVHPEDREAIVARVGAATTSPVEFVAQVRTLEKLEVDLLVEIGPGARLGRFVQEVLPGGTMELISLDAAPGGLRAALEGVARLLARGVPIRPLELFYQRGPASIAAEVRTDAPEAGESWIEAVRQHQETSQQVLRTHAAVLAALGGVPPRPGAATSGTPPLAAAAPSQQASVGLACSAASTPGHCGGDEDEGL
jgi:acyl transferase domain-containing protein